MQILKRNSVRRNLTLDAELANQIEKLSRLSNMSQGDIILQAMQNWNMRILLAFADSAHPIADSCDAYVCSHVGNVKSEYFDVYVNCFHEFFSVAEFYTTPENVRVINSYVANHIPMPACQKHAALKQLFELASAGKFADLEDSQALAKNIRAYLDFLLGVKGCWEIYQDDYFLRILVVLFRDCCQPVLESCRQAVYARFAIEMNRAGLAV